MYVDGELEEATRPFAEYYSYRRYHEGTGNITPYDVYTGRHHETLQGRKDYNKTVRKQGTGL
ncbi:MAG: hypothetical protein ISS55_08245 [Dehalococcoidales bacterium]|nr:hypothetical protein [Dehalococcoidales bacterium]